MANNANPTTTADTPIRWTLPPAGRERQRSRARRVLRQILLRFRLHLAVFALLAAVSTLLFVRGGIPITSTLVPILHSVGDEWTILLFVIAVLGFVLWGVYFGTSGEIVYEIDEAGVGWRNRAGRYRIAWERIEKYEIETEAGWPGLVILKLKIKTHSVWHEWVWHEWVWHEWAFDPGEVDEAEIRRRMQEHSVSDAAGRPWFARRTK